MVGERDIKVVERIFSDLKSYSIDYFNTIIRCYRPRGKSLHDSYLTQMQKRKMNRKSCCGRLQYDRVDGRQISRLKSSLGMIFRP